MKTATAIISFCVSLTLLSGSADAAVIDQVKSKVDSINTKVNELRTKVNGITSKLDPITGVQDKFAEAGIDPAELLDLIPTDDIQDTIERLREIKAEKEANLNDPTLEDFRWELREMVLGLATLARPGAFESTPMPIVTLIENAPLPVLGVFRKVIEPVFEEMKERVTNTVAMINQLNAAGLADLKNVSFDQVSYREPKFVPVALLTPEEREEAVCSVAGHLYPYKIVLWAAKTNFKGLQMDLGYWIETLEKRHSRPIDVQIHGYFGGQIDPTGLSVQQLRDLQHKIKKQEQFVTSAGEVIELAEEIPACETFFNAIS